MAKRKNLAKAIKNPDVRAVFAAYPEKVKSKMYFLRQLILDTASSIKELGEIEETLKWGEPSYLTPKSKLASTIRIDWKEKDPDQYAIYFKCTANLVPAFKEKYPDQFTYGGDRSIIFDLDENIPEPDLKNCIALALTYHKNKKLESAERWKYVKKITGF